MSAFSPSMCHENKPSPEMTTNCSYDKQKACSMLKPNTTLDWDQSHSVRGIIWLLQYQDTWWLFICSYIRCGLFCISFEICGFVVKIRFFRLIVMNINFYFGFWVIEYLTERSSISPCWYNSRLLSLDFFKPTLCMIILFRFTSLSIWQILVH